MIKKDIATDVARTIQELDATQNFQRSADGLRIEVPRTVLLEALESHPAGALSAIQAFKETVGGVKNPLVDGEIHLSIPIAHLNELSPPVAKSSGQAAPLPDLPTLANEIMKGVETGEVKQGSGSLGVEKDSDIGRKVGAMQNAFVEAGVKVRVSERHPGRLLIPLIPLLRLVQEGAGVQAKF